MNKNKNKKLITLVVILIGFILLATSVTSSNIKIKKESFPKAPSLADYYYEWTDDFDNQQLIDITKSWGYEVTGGFARMENTYPVWTDPSWERLRPITLHNSGTALVDHAFLITIPYNSNMNPNYEDIRFKHENTPTTFLNYWIESYDTASADVWVKVPTIPAGSSMFYLFYKNPSASSQSDFFSVFTDWAPKEANDIKISYKANNEGAWDSDVAYGNNRFFVAWEEGTVIYIQQEIRGSIYDMNGDVVVFDKLIYKDNTAQQFRNENPSIAYGGGKFFIAWEHYGIGASGVTNPTTMDIYGRTVTPSGDLGSLIHICTASSCQADSNVAFDSVNNRFCVVWEDARNGVTNYDIYGRLYDTNGNPVGGEKPICTAANSQCEPWVAFNPIHEQYMIVWEEGLTANNGPFSIKAGLFDKNLNQLGSTITIAVGTDDVDHNFPCVEFNPESQRYLVTWNDCDISSGDWWGNVWGRIFDYTGNTIVNNFIIKAGNFVRTDIVNYLGSCFFVSFDDNANIWGKLVLPDGQVITTDVKLSASQAAEADWANMAVGQGKIFVTWEDERISSSSYPDAYGNIWSLNIPTGSAVTYTLGQEKELILQAQITSKHISAANLLSWYDFLAEFTGTIQFDVLDSTGDIVLKSNINPGQSLADINPQVHPIIRLRAKFSRSMPSSSPELDSWTVRYLGVDTEPPKTYVDYIDGIKGLNDWYIQESVTVYLGAIDYPENTGSGVNTTYYTLNAGPPQIYNKNGGIVFTVYAPGWMGQWDINFWSVDNQGNVEDKTKPENNIKIKIDAARPYVKITDPVNEQSKESPFWVRAIAYDNAQLDRVEFDIEPFGERPGLPWSDTTPPYEWFCDVPISRPRNLAKGEEPVGRGVNLMVRAQAFDKSGQTMIHEVWVHITNPISRPRVFTIANFRQIIEKIKIGVVVDNALSIEVFGLEDADSIKLEATRVFTRKTTTVWDTDLSDGAAFAFDIPTGFYKIVATLYKEGKVIEKEFVSRVLFINK